MNIFKKIKRRRQCIEGLAILEDGIKIGLNQAEWHLGFNDLTEEEKIRYETIKRHCEYLLNEIKDIWDGKLHY